MFYLVKVIPEIAKVTLRNTRCKNVQISGFVFPLCPFNMWIFGWRKKKQTTEDNAAFLLLTYVITYFSPQSLGFLELFPVLTLFTYLQSKFQLKWIKKSSYLKPGGKLNRKKWFQTLISNHCENLFHTSPREPHTLKRKRNKTWVDLLECELKQGPSSKDKQPPPLMCNYTPSVCNNSV